jgi:adhesin/invasin
LGAGNPPTVPQLNVVGFSTAVEAIKENDPIFNFPGVYGLTFVVPPTLGSGSFPISISINNVSSTTRFLPVQSTGLNLSQTGVTFRAVAGSPNALQRTITVSSTSQIINWTATTATISGGTWLQVSPAAGSSDPSKPAPTIQITASAAQLQAGNVYGTVTIRSNLAQQVITVVLSVLPPTQSPGAVVEPTGIVFIGAPGAAPPAAKTTQISNPTTAALTFTTKSAFSTAASWFTFQPAIGSVAPGTPVTITVQPVTGLAAGTYSGSITFTFSDATQRVVNLLLVLSAGASGGSSASLGIAAATCAPSKLLPVFTLLGLNFTSPVAWPTNIDAFVVDDCGTAVTTGAVSASFSNGDSPLGLVSLQNGHFAATWTPRNPVNANLVVTVKASVFSPNLSGTASLSGSAPANPNIPIVFSGGVVGTASYVASPAPGTLISLFGAELADNLLSATQLPLPNQLLTTQVVLGGVNLPLVFVSAGQINALVPYGLKPKTSYQVIVQRGTVISTPETVAVLDSQPAVFTTDQSGKGQGHIYHITADGLQILAGVGQAVTAGDVLTVYCSGLGEVTPPTVAGSPAPLDTLENTTNPVTATIGGVSAKMLFAGLTPGFTGLYQVNLIVPGGVAAGDSVPVVLSSAGQVSQPVTIAVR